jgi:N-methylhydantoinase A/oxoprolinase/acetone carboxylase beta subunit
VERRVSVEDPAAVAWRVYQRHELPPTWKARGPCIIEQVDSTTVVLSGQRVRQLGNGCLMISEEGRT